MILIQFMNTLQITQEIWISDDHFQIEYWSITTTYRNMYLLIIFYEFIAFCVKCIHIHIIFFADSLHWLVKKRLKHCYISFEIGKGRGDLFENFIDYRLWFFFINALFFFSTLKLNGRTFDYKDFDFFSKA